MPPFRGTRSAFGGPGDDPRWTGAAKDGVGTAHFFGGRVWFTNRTRHRDRGLLPDD